MRMSHRSPGQWIKAALLAASLVATAASAQSWPSKPIKLVVPFGAGGGVDQVARLIAGHFQTAFANTPIIVENRPGGATIIAAEYVARAPADGSTLMICTASTVSANPHLYEKLPYDPQKDFAPIGMVSSVPFFLVVPARSGIASVRQFLDHARANTAAVSFASAGNGTTGHLGFELLARSAGFKAVHVPYKSYAAAMPDLLTGRVSAMMADLPVIGGAIKAGNLRPLATTVGTRSPFLPDVPTLAESGLPGFDMSVWFALFAPAGTPAPVIERLNGELGRFLRSTEGDQRLRAIGQIPTSSTPAELAALQKAEFERWGKIIREAGIKPN